MSGSVLSHKYRSYALAVLSTAYGVALFDGILVALLMQAIKVDLRLSDTQVGLVAGVAFGVFYATLGVPIARWVDRGDRVRIMALVTGCAGLAALGYSVVATFWQLLLVRLFQGAGDAGSRLPGYSLIGDYFPEPADRNRALYVWWIAQPVASFIVNCGGGWLGERFGWRVPFLVSGTLGLVAAAVVGLTLKEPRASVRAGTPGTMRSTLSDVLRLLWRRRSCRYILCAIVGIYLVGTGALSWQAVYMIRRFELGTAELGLWLGILVGLGTVASTLVGRYVVDRLMANDERRQLRLAALTICCGPLIFAGFLFSPDKAVALALLLVLSVVLAMFAATPYVLLQRLVPEDMRATSLASVLAIAKLAGFGFGPLVVGALSDQFSTAAGDGALRLAMLTLSPLWFVVGALLLLAAKSIRSDLETASSEQSNCLVNLHAGADAVDHDADS